MRLLRYVLLWYGTVDPVRACVIDKGRTDMGWQYWAGRRNKLLCCSVTRVFLEGTQCVCLVGWMWVAAVDGGCSKNHNKLFLLNFLKKFLSNFHLKPTKSESWWDFSHPLSKLWKLVQGWLRFSWIWVGTIFFKWEKEKGWWEDGCKVRFLPKKGEGLRRYT